MSSSKNPMLIQLESLTKSIGGKSLFENVSLSIHKQDRVAFVGPNGSGKSSLFKILSGEWASDSGGIHAGSQVKISYLKQENHIEFLGSLDQYLKEHPDFPEWQVKRIASGLGISEDQYQKSFQQLSGGFRIRFLLACELAKEPDLILLDEPTNHLDLESVLFLEHYLKNYKKAFLLISHDREFLKNTCNSTMEIKNKGILKLPLQIEEYFVHQAEREEHKKREQKRIEERREKLQSFVDRFRAKASKAKQAQSRLKQLEALPEITQSPLDFIPKIPIPKALESGKRILETQSGAIGYGEKLVLKNLDMSLFRGEKIGIVGQNGAGKSTLLKHLAGLLPDAHGNTPKYYKNCDPAYFAQHLSDQLSPESTPLDFLLKHSSLSTQEQEILDLLGGLGFSGTDWSKPIRVLSGGEKMRVMLARILLLKSPLLLLDEPTNHLDFQSVEAMAKSLQEADCTIILVSHDRSFVSQICNKIIEVDQKEAKLFPGSYQEYIWKKQEQDDDFREEERTLESFKGEANSVPEPSEKTNHKEEKKRMRTRHRELEKALEKNEALQKEISAKIEASNQSLLVSTGLDASNLAKEISSLQEQLSELEMEWLEFSEEKEKILI